MLKINPNVKKLNLDLDLRDGLLIFINLMWIWILKFKTFSKTFQIFIIFFDFFSFFIILTKYGFLVVLVFILHYSRSSHFLNSSFYYTVTFLSGWIFILIFYL